MKSTIRYLAGFQIRLGVTHYCNTQIPLIFDRILIICGFILCLQTISYAQLWPVQNIPTDLLIGADMVVRNRTDEITISGERKYTYKRSHVFTVLNKKAIKYKSLYIFYDKLKKVNIHKCTVYDSHGTEIKSFKKSDFKDESFIPDYSLYDDTRVLYNEIPDFKLPFTIHFEYEITNFDNTLIFPTWSPQIGPGIAIEKATLQVTYPTSFPIRYKKINLENEPDLIKSDKYQVLNFVLNNQLASKYEEFSSNQIFPEVHIAPIEFFFDGYSGTMESWQTFGNWLSSLFEENDKIGNKSELFLRTLRKKGLSKKEIVESVYHFVQNNTRYVSIQLGIGGYKPFPASFVEKNGYGDCKALTNYAKSILAKMGIESYPAIIGAGRDKEQTIRWLDFPSVNQANHVILMVPLDRDTIWLECTSQINPFGHLGYFTANRWALVLDPNGESKVIRTPSYQDFNSCIKRVLVYDLLKGQEISGTLKSTYQGLDYDYARLKYLKKEHQTEYALEQYSEPNLTVNQISWSDSILAFPYSSESFDFEVKEYGRQIGSKIIFKPQALTSYDYVPSQSINRKSPIQIAFHRIRTDSIHISLPDEYWYGKTPTPLTLKEDFGEYYLRYTIQDKSLIIIQTLHLKAGCYPSNQNQVFASFWKRIREASNRKIILSQRKT